MLSQMNDLLIVKIKNKLSTGLQNVTLNVEYDQSIIGEIQLRVGSKPVNYHANHLVYEMERVDSVT